MKKLICITAFISIWTLLLLMKESYYNYTRSRSRSEKHADNNIL